MTGADKKYQNFAHCKAVEFYGANKHPDRWFQDSAAGFIAYKHYYEAYYHREQQYIAHYFDNAKYEVLEQ